MLPTGGNVQHDSLVFQYNNNYRYLRYCVSSNDRNHQTKHVIDNIYTHFLEDIVHVVLIKKNVVMCWWLCFQNDFQNDLYHQESRENRFLQTFMTAMYEFKKTSKINVDHQSEKQVPSTKIPSNFRL